MMKIKPDRLHKSAWVFFSGASSLEVHTRKPFKYTNTLSPAAHQGFRVASTYLEKTPRVSASLKKEGLISLDYALKGIQNCEFVFVEVRIEGT